MNLNRLNPSWDQFKVINGLIDIDEAEILSCIEPEKKSTNKFISKRMAQNALVYSFLLFALSGGCAL
jgi:hypothetical protein